MNIRAQLLYEIYKALLTLQIALISGIAVTVIKYGFEKLSIELLGVFVFVVLSWLTKRVKCISGGVNAYIYFTFVSGVCGIFCIRLIND
ncbi:hypothetical protein SAMN06265339_1395 [Desulfurobacterium pacificum]|uniref:Uncharacterized protein n=1 Tax=Desulfurobacterium pacificum TaxID=240166 RepID=A0ABY1NRQ3_9BACT|nr:hypothetical protein SAMN06265339_1395 [Desulfurobacterium pacificum]